MRYVAILMLGLAAQTAVADTTPAADYDVKDNWLCRPDHPRACESSLDATIVAADGELTKEPFEPASDPAFDCFYVYPTVSLDETPNSDLNAGPEEMSVINGQFARFGEVCRTFAPLYRQVTLTALRAGLSGGAMDVDRELGYRDVAAAWNHYLEKDNDGRGVVLIGHSQGAGVLTRLLAREIDGKPIEDQLISALILGSSGVTVAGDDGEGGTFESIEPCEATDQTGCVVQFASFRSTVPPPAESLFGRPREGGGRALCSNPANLAGGSGELEAYLRNDPETQWVNPPADIETPFVKVPGMLTAECVERDGLSWLEVTVHGNERDARTDDIPGDVIQNGEVVAGWGLHLIDVHLAMGNLVELVRSQGEAHLGRE